MSHFTSTCVVSLNMNVAGAVIVGAGNILIWTNLAHFYICQIGVTDKNVKYQFLNMRCCLTHLLFSNT